MRVKTIVFLYVSIFISTVKISAQTHDTIQDKPPQLLTNPLITSSKTILKRGLWGSATVEATIDSIGYVKTCRVMPSGKTSFDSLVNNSILSATFSPAIENGTPVSSIVNLEVHVPFDSLLSQCNTLSPILSGTIIDTALKIPVMHARILLHYQDSTEDSSITIGFNHYLSLIGNSTNQQFNKNLLITTSDSSGHFAFRLLPAGHFTLSVQSTGYEIGQFSGSISSDQSIRCSYALKQLDNIPHDTTNEIIVYGTKAISPESVNINEEEKHIGFSPYLSNIIQSRPDIRIIPEGPSMMLVRSGCPYDNVYMIAGVPMLSPFHFGGHPYADIDGVMISAISNIKVTIDDISAKRIDASGCIINATPGRVIYDNGVECKGLYLKGDFGWQGIDLLAAYTSKKNNHDYLQAGYSFCNDYGLKFNFKRYLSTSEGNWGIGIPLTYGNATLLGSKSIGKVQGSFFGWFAWDKYNALKSLTPEQKINRSEQIYYNRIAPKDKSFFPWGMGSIRFSGNSTNRSFTIGGSHQYFGTGKQHINTNITRQAFVNNGELTADFDTVIKKPLICKLSARVNLTDWNGFIVKQSAETSDTLFSPQRAETGVYINSTILKQTGRIIAKVDLLGSVTGYEDSIQLTGDAGVSITYGTPNVNTGLYMGRVTSRPDIRGLPDSLFRMQLNRTYIASMPFFFRYSIIPKISITPYLRYSTNAPQLDPVYEMWNPEGTTPMFAAGADIGFRIIPLPWAELTASCNIAEAQRLGYKNNVLPYEWDLPWTIRTNLHLHTRNDRFHIYVDYIRTEGLPYYDFDSEKYELLPDYRSLDFNFQVHTHLPAERHITKLDCYLEVKNVRDLLYTSNVRAYYWDSFGKQPIRLGYGRVDIGTRFGIRM